MEGKLRVKENKEDHTESKKESRKQGKIIREGKELREVNKEEDEKIKRSQSTKKKGGRKQRKRKGKGKLQRGTK